MFTYAQSVCKSVSYCLSDEDTDLGHHVATAPLHLVLDILRSWGDAYATECEWIREMLEMTRQRGMGIVAFLSGVRD